MWRRYSVLTSAVLPEVMPDNEFSSTNSSFAACSEYTISHEMGGALSFIKSSLQSCVAPLASFRQVLIAAVRRAIQLLAATKYTSEEGADPGQEEESELEPKRYRNGDNTIVGDRGVQPFSRQCVGITLGHDFYRDTNTILPNNLREDELLASIAVLAFLTFKDVINSNRLLACFHLMRCRWCRGCLSGDGLLCSLPTPKGCYPWDGCGSHTWEA